MSRVGMRPIEVPDGTKVQVREGVFIAEGPNGKVTENILEGFPIDIQDGVVTVSRTEETVQARAKHGLVRALLANAVAGATTGFTKVLELHGVGYRAEVKGREVHFALGYSHPVIYKIPEGIEIAVDRSNRITVSGAQRQLVGQVGAELRSLRKPDPYKGKGIKYADEVLRRKVGKAGAKV